MRALSVPHTPLRAVAPLGRDDALLRVLLGEPICGDERVRQRLPNCRPNQPADLWFSGVRHHLTIGYRLDGRPGETFLHGARVGSDSDGLHSDIGVLLSRALQHGDDPVLLASGMARLGDGTTPASIIGAITDMLAHETATG